MVGEFFSDLMLAVIFIDLNQFVISNEGAYSRMANSVVVDWECNLCAYYSSIHSAAPTGPRRISISYTYHRYCMGAGKIQANTQYLHHSN